MLRHMEVERVLPSPRAVLLSPLTPRRPAPGDPYAPHSCWAPLLAPAPHLRCRALSTVLRTHVHRGPGNTSTVDVEGQLGCVTGTGQEPCGGTVSAPNSKG